MKLILICFLVLISLILILNETCNPDEKIEQINAFMDSSHVNDEQRSDLHYLVNLISSSKDKLCENDLFKNKYNSLFNNIKNIKTDLTIISRYQIPHKFYEIDRRVFYNEKIFLNKSKSRPVQFVNTFPNPPILDEYPQVAYYCKKSSWDCIDFIESTIRKNYEIFSKNLQKLYSNDNYFQNFTKVDFKNHWELFNFHTTASYYLCWHTLNREMTMSKYDGNCFKDAIFFRQENNDELNQLVYSYFHNDNLLFDFDCSLFSFCPDVCCNHTDILIKHNITYDSIVKDYFKIYIRMLAYLSIPEIADNAKDIIDDLADSVVLIENYLSALNLIVSEKCRQDEQNPCKGFGDSNCKLSLYDNKNINDLKRSLINVTCQCQSGFFYSSQTDSCQDIDECESDMNNNCSKFKDQMCLNTFGSYVCLCHNGYKLNKSGQCEPDQTLYDQVIKSIID